MNPAYNKINYPLPLLVVGVALLGGGMFVLGRNTATNSPAKPIVLTEDKHSHENGHSDGEDEHNHDHDHSHDEKHEEGEGGHEEHSVDESIVFSPEALDSAQIVVANATLKPQVSGLPFSGQIETSPDNVARVASVVPGRIVRLNATIGQKVQKGQTLALIESRSVGEAQSAYSQAAARLQNARSNYDVTLKQAKAGVYSRGPLEAARRAHVEAVADVRTQEAAVQKARVSLENVSRLAKTGSFARPALETARSQYASALESFKAAEAALDNARASVSAAQTELTRRRQVAASGGYSSRPVEEARRVLVAAQSARATSQSEVATTRANLNRAKSLAVEGLISTRDLEAAQTAFDTANARLQSSTADETAANQELERQQKLATSNVAASAEVEEAQARLVQAQADERTRRAEVSRARENMRSNNTILNRERAVFSGNIANRREFAEANSNLQNALIALSKARQTLAITDTAYKREVSIYRQNLNNTAQVQSAKAALTSAQSELEAAQTALSLLKSAPGGNAVVPIRAPLSGVVQERTVTQGEVVAADQNLLTIVDLSIVHVDMNIPERDIARLRVGDPVKVLVDAIPNQSFSGHLELIHTELNPKTRTIEAHAELKNPGNLKAGMFARGTIGTGNQSYVVMVPADSVQDLEGKKVVFVSGKKAGEFKAREVVTGVTTNGQTHIKSGLNPAEKVVVKGAFMVKAQALKAELGHNH
jgi:RND family efflux transporter MFP subunit